MTTKRLVLGPGGRKGRFTYLGQEGLEIDPIRVRGNGLEQRARRDGRDAPLEMHDAAV